MWEEMHRQIPGARKAGWLEECDLQEVGGQGLGAGAQPGQAEACECCAQELHGELWGRRGP